MSLTVEALARLFHEHYERLAPDYGYATREDMRTFDPASANGRLMLAVCGEVIYRLAPPQPAYDRELIATMLYEGASVHKFTVDAIREQINLLRDADNADAAGVRTVSRPPKPAGAVPLPKYDVVCAEGDIWAFSDRAMLAYGDAREASAVARHGGEAPAWFGQLPAPISNPEAWPENYAGGYNDALAVCYDVIRGNLPQQMTTQGEAVGFLAGNWRVSEDAFNIYHDNFGSDVMLTLNGDFESCQHRHDFANAIARKLTGSQP